MGNRRSREYRLQQEREADWHRARIVPRLAMDDVTAVGIGPRRLQLIVCPSFNEGLAWEVRQQESKWSLFRSRVVSPWPAVQLAGYDPVPIESSVLSSLFDRVVALRVPVLPDLSGMAGVDGTITQLAVFGDMWFELRFQWWSEAPAQWRPLIEIADEMLRAFSAAEDSRV